MAMYSVLPNVQKTSYVGGDMITFELNADPNLAILPGTVRISGAILVGKSTTFDQIDLGAEVFMNSTVGMHAAFDQVSVSCPLRGTLENISDYGRTVLTVRQSVSGQLESTSDSQLAQELCLPDAYSYSQLFYGRGAGQNFRTLDFCVAPQICLNQSAQMIPFKRTGTITVQTTISQKYRLLHGDDAATSDFRLSNLQLTYIAAPVIAKMTEMPVVLGKTECVRRQLATSSTSFQTNASLSASSVLATFIPQADLADPAEDSYKSVNIQIAQLGFTYNDGDSLVSYQLDSQEEIMMNYLFALKDGADFSSALAMVQGLNSDIESPAHMGYGIGAKFEPAVDMVKSQLGVMINGASVPATVIGYFVFRGGIVI